MTDPSKETHQLNSIYHAERKLKAGNVPRATRIVNKLASTPSSERVDVLRAATTVLSGKPVATEVNGRGKVEKTQSIGDFSSEEAFTDPVTHLVATAMIRLRERDESVMRLPSLKKRDAQFKRGAQYLAEYAPVGSIDIGILIPEDGDAIATKQIEVLENYNGQPHVDRDHRPLNPLSH